MREYETIFIVQPEISDEARAGLCDKLEKLLDKEGGTKLMWDDWGKRKLAYEIQKFQKGHYYQLSYLDSGPVVSELERALKLEESVLRYMTVQVTDEVDDIETRKAEAAEQERIAREKAEAERAARAAEEKARQEAAAAAAAEAEAAAKQAAEAAEAAEAAKAEEASSEESADAEAPEAEAAADESAGEAEAEASSDESADAEEAKE